jgi:hypothetical protein
VEIGVFLIDFKNIGMLENIFDMEVQSSGYSSRDRNKSVGIYINNENVTYNYTNPVHAYIDLNGNIIKHSKTGIQTEFAYATIEGNEILDMNDNMTQPPCGEPFYPPCPWPAPPPLPKPYGIRAMNDVVDIKLNKVENNSAYYGSSQPSANQEIVGISLENALHATEISNVNCNKVKNTGVGLRFVNDCGSGTNVLRNTMQDHYYGFMLKNSGEIGDVGSNGTASDNEWNGSDYDVSKTFADNSDGSLSKLYVQNASVDPIYDPYIDISHATSGYNELGKDNTGNSASSGCTAPALMRNPTDPKDKLNIQKSGGSKISWEIKQVMNGSKTYAFVPDSLRLLNKQLLYRQILRDSSLRYDTAYKSFTDSMKNTSNGRALGHSNKTSRTAANNFEANLMLITPIIEKMKVDSTLSGSDTTNLLKVALKCPYYDGIAVYQARRALYQLGYPLMAHDCETTLPVKKGQKRLRSVEAENTFAIYPNPTKEIINLRFEVKEGSEIYFDLHDIVGKRMMRKRLSNAMLHTIKLEPMHHGIYLYRLTNENEILKSGKLVIK